MSATPAIQFVECPRDAMQGWKHLIPTEQKVAYINALLQVGFHTIDFGSFVSPKAIPQMADTAAVLQQLNLSHTRSKLLAIVANTRGAEEALVHEAINYLGFPFSISPTFQLRNTNSTMEASLERVEEIQNLCMKNNRQLVVYLSMGFGNPYGDAYDESILLHWAHEMAERGITIISLADTVGLATPQQVTTALTTLIPQYPQVEFGVHLHSTPANWQQKLQAAIDAGCKRYDGAILGIGGCPMANDDLVGNMNTGWMLEHFKQQGIETGIDEAALEKCNQMARKIFN